MTPEDAFLLDIGENPDDDTPRLIFADWLDDNDDPDRAAFIRIQCRRATLPESDPDNLPLRHQAEDLLRRHWHDWVRPIGRLLSGSRHVEGWLQSVTYQPEALHKFRRGFLYVLDIDADRFLSCAADLFRLTPLRHLRLHGIGTVAGRLADCPHLCRVEGIECVDYFSTPLDAAGMAALARSPWLGRLRVLGLYRNNLGDAGLTALASAPWLASLATVELGDNGISARGIADLARTTQPFRPSRLRLGGNPIGDEGVRLLAGSPIVSCLRSLAMDRCDLGPEAGIAMAASPHLLGLTFLDLSGNPDFGAEGWRHLEQAAWWPRFRTFKAIG